MCQSRHILPLVVAAIVLAGPLTAECAEDNREVSFVVRVCEGEDFLRLLGNEAVDRWDDCDRPLAGIPVVLGSGESKSGPIETGPDGIAAIGPILADRNAEIRLAVGCTQHVCLTLRLHPRGVSDGMNHFLYHTIKLEKVKEQAKSDEGGDGEQASWAQSIDLKGVPNLHRVSADFYRSAQPTALGMQNLKQMGIETIVSLRSFHSDRDEIGDTGLGYEHIYVKAWHPEREEVVRFLQIVTNPKRTPGLVHCKHGADRTGAMSAVYRIAVQGWTKEEAIREMTEGDFGFHGVFRNLPRWIKDLDIESIKKEAGMARHHTGGSNN
jgi:protein tyrosine phosphatase (PTP) superfamily phosphohydrolase (DUF442 family)